MSYELVRSLSIDIDNFKLKISCASNNISPMKYEKFERTGVLKEWKNVEGLTETEKFLFPLITDVYGGMLKLQKSVSKKIRYAMLKTKYTIDQLDKENQTSIFDYSYNGNAANYTDNIKEIVSMFLNAYHEVDEKINSIFIIDEDKYLVKIKKHGISYSYSLNQAKKYSSLKEMKIDNDRLEQKGFKNLKTIKIR